MKKKTKKTKSRPSASAIVIGSSLRAEDTVALKEALLEIMATPAGDAVKIRAMELMANTAPLRSVSISNNTFTQ